MRADPVFVTASAKQTEETDLRWYATNPDWHHTLDPYLRADKRTLWAGHLRHLAQHGVDATDWSALISACTALVPVDQAEPTAAFDLDGPIGMAVGLSGSFDHFIALDPTPGLHDVAGWLRSGLLVQNPTAVGQDIYAFLRSSQQNKPAPRWFSGLPLLYAYHVGLAHAATYAAAGLTITEALQHQQRLHAGTATLDEVEVLAAYRPVLLHQSHLDAEAAGRHLLEGRMHVPVVNNIPSGPVDDRTRQKVWEHRNADPSLPPLSPCCCA